MWLQQFESFGINNSQKSALIFLREVGAIDNNSYRQLSGDSNRVSGRQLRQLRLAGIIEQKNSGKYTYYVSGKAFLNTLPARPEGLSTQLSGLSPQPEDISSELPEQIRFQLAKLGARSNNPEEIPDLIVALCRHKNLSIAELSALLNRSEKHIKRGYIARLMKEGRLFYTIPEMPHHPDQQYSSKK